MTQRSRALNSWRQGCQVDAQHAVSMGWKKAEEADTLLVVITHDCDLQSPAESEVELIRARFVDRVSGDHTHGKNPRVINIPNALGAEVALEITHKDRLRVSKEQLLASSPVNALIDSDRTQLAAWLASRYNRAPFPDSFDQRLKKARTVLAVKLKNKDVSRVKKEGSLAKQLLGVFVADGGPIEGIYFGLKGNEFFELSAKDDYSLVVVVVAKSRRAEDEEACLALATVAAEKIKGLFEHADWDKSVGKIVLEVCASSTEKDFSLYDLRRMLRWHLDWLSGEEDEAVNFLNQKR